MRKKYFVPHADDDLEGGNGVPEPVPLAPLDDDDRDSFVVGDQHGTLSPADVDDDHEPGGADLLDELENFLGDYVAWPDEHALVAATLWAVHTHALTAFESTPKLALLSRSRSLGRPGCWSCSSSLSLARCGRPAPHPPVSSVSSTRNARRS